MILFVNGLNKRYEDVRNQILLTEPLSTISKAYSLVLQIEHQNEAYQVGTKLNAFNLNNKKDDSAKRPFDKKKNLMDKKIMVCELCKKKREGRGAW